MERLTVLQLCSITILLGAALLLPAPRGTQALSETRQKNLDVDQDLAMETIQAIELPEEGKISEEVEPGTSVFSSSAWAPWGPQDAQVGPEEDRDHLYHPQDNAREANAHGPPQRLFLEVQSSPEEDLDHLHHS